MSHTPITLPTTRIIAVSGRIGAGSTSLGKGLAQLLGWKHIEGGEIFWEAVRKRMQLSPKDTHLRPDEEDRLFDEQLKTILREESHVVVEAKLAVFNAQGINNIFKVGVVCVDKHGIDQTGIRIDRLVNRESVSVNEAKAEVLEREMNDLEKWRKLYTNGDEAWTYWDAKYCDLVVNTFVSNKEESVQLVATALQIPQEKR